MHSGFRLFRRPRLDLLSLSTAQPAGLLQHRANEGRRGKGTLMASRLIRAISFGSLVLALLVLTLPATSVAQVAFSISFGPPALPIYTQPRCPADGYIWTPGYWAYDSDYNDYYWVPGTWVMAPQPGLFWTPGYWAWNGNGFFFNEGYWAPQVGFYGGINYGYGYFGQGYQGGRWDHDRFYYNRAVNNVNVTNVRYVYNTTVINNNTTINRVSYNGGKGGVNARPSAKDQAIARERHVSPVAAQVEHVRDAKGDPQLRASQNRGKPPVAATQKPGAFKDREAVAAKQAGGAYNPPPNRADNRNPNARPASGQPVKRPASAQPDNSRPDNRPDNPQPSARPDNSKPETPTARQRSSGQRPTRQPAAKQSAPGQRSPRTETRNAAARATPA